MNIVVNRPLLLGTVGLAAVLAIALVLWQVARGDAQENNITAMPAMTLVYETDGPSVSAGGQAVTVRETRRLDYVSKTEWTDTVIAAPSVDLGRYGTGSTVGSYRKLNGNTITTYDALVGGTDTDTLEEGVIHEANMALVYGSIPAASMDGAADLTRSEVTSTSRVCQGGTCRDSVPAVKYTGGGEELVVYRTDDWSIPLRMGEGFVVRSVTVLGD